MSGRLVTQHSLRRQPIVLVAAASRQRSLHFAAFRSSFVFFPSFFFFFLLPFPSQVVPRFDASVSTFAWFAPNVPGRASSHRRAPCTSSCRRVIPPAPSCGWEREERQGEKEGVHLPLRNQTRKGWERGPIYPYLGNGSPHNPSCQDASKHHQNRDQALLQSESPALVRGAEDGKGEEVPRRGAWDYQSLSHPCATFWADESLILVFHHVVLSKRTGQESSSFWTLFHVVVSCSLPSCLLPVCATLRGVTFGNQSVLGCLRVEMGIRAVRLRDAFGW